MKSHYREGVHRLIVWVRYLRRIKPVKYGFFGLLLLLMLVGLKVATIPLAFPEQLQLNDKVIHVVVFFGFAVLVDLVSAREPFWFWKALPLILYGVGIEVVQHFIPERNFSMLDALADAVGVLLYWVSKRMLQILDERR